MNENKKERRGWVRTGSTLVSLAVLGTLSSCGEVDAAEEAEELAVFWIGPDVVFDTEAPPKRIDQVPLILTVNEWDELTRDIGSAEGLPPSEGAARLFVVPRAEIEWPLPEGSPPDLEYTQKCPEGQTAVNYFQVAPGVWKVDCLPDLLSAPALRPTTTNCRLILTSTGPSCLCADDTSFQLVNPKVWKLRTSGYSFSMVSCD